ncbi:MAG: hypothetical protein JSS66_07405 [Armatimonadetes bacterium]|nr:hypothetical protein [Armatimonadota bacterium]
MWLVTGPVHCGKSTALREAGVRFVSWDEWFEDYLPTDKAKTALAGLLTDAPMFVLRKQLALEPSLMRMVCIRCARAFRAYCEDQEVSVCEVPLYALKAVQQAGDTSVCLQSPDHATHVARFAAARQCDLLTAERMVGTVGLIECDVCLDTEDLEGLRAHICQAV